MRISNRTCAIAAILLLGVVACTPDVEPSAKGFTASKSEPPKKDIPERPLSKVKITYYYEDLTKQELAEFKSRLKRLRSELQLSKVDGAIKRGSTHGFEAFPVNGYKDGLTGFLSRYGLQVDPKRSFTECGFGQIEQPTGQYLPGCVVSLKIIYRYIDGRVHDTGLNPTWGRTFDDTAYCPNDSYWAQRMQYRRIDEWIRNGKVPHPWPVSRM